MAPPIRTLVDHLREVFDHFDLVRDFGAAEDGDAGALGVGGGHPQILQFLVHQQAGGGLLHELDHADGGSVSAMRGAEGVVHIDVAEFGELLGEGGIVLFFFLMEAEIFQQQNFAGRGQHGLDRGPDAIGREFDGAAEQFLQFAATGFMLISAFGLPFGRPRWEARMTPAPCSSAYLMVGSEARMRLSLVISCPPLASGTLKSTRMKTRFPLRSRSLIESLGMAEIRD